MDVGHAAVNSFQPGEYYDHKMWLSQSEPGEFKSGLYDHGTNAYQAIDRLPDWDFMNDDEVKQEMAKPENMYAGNKYLPLEWLLKKIKEKMGFGGPNVHVHCLACRVY